MFVSVFSSRLKRAAASQHFRAGGARSGGSPGSSLSIPGDAAGTATLAHGTPEQRLVGAGAGSFAVGAVQCPWRGGIPSASLPWGDGEGVTGKAGVPLGLRSCSRPFFARCFLAKFEACRAAASLQPPRRGYFHLGGPYPPQHGFCGLEKEMR